MSAEYFASLKESTDQLAAETDGKSIEELDRMMADVSGRLRTFIAEHEDIEDLNQ
ncbi:hypothetical protein [Paenibacillus durus]|uniref:hypothetical protein n=1 Tax=Paenibacillus durus TaxID=44251 RepID=UPI0004B87694|nr:hypothetical protein [Paenibacillus durus]